MIPKINIPTTTLTRVDSCNIKNESINLVSFVSHMAKLILATFVP